MTKYYVKASTSKSDGWGGIDNDTYEGIMELEVSVESVKELKDIIKDKLSINPQLSISILMMVPVP